MKSFIATYCKTLLRVTVLTVTALFGLCSCAGNYKKTVTSVEEMTLTLRGMRGSFVYKLEEMDGKTKLCYYREVYSNNKDTLELLRSAECDRQGIIAIMNECAVMRWDGFHGKHPKNVHDGIMFTFKAAVNGGNELYADGSANFPKGYREFVEALNKMLEGK